MTARLIVAGVLAVAAGLVLGVWAAVGVVVGQATVETVKACRDRGGRRGR